MGDGRATKRPRVGEQGAELLRRSQALRHATITLSAGIYFNYDLDRHKVRGWLPGRWIEPMNACATPSFPWADASHSQLRLKAVTALTSLPQSLIEFLHRSPSSSSLPPRDKPLSYILLVVCPLLQLRAIVDDVESGSSIAGGPG